MTWVPTARILRPKRTVADHYRPRRDPVLNRNELASILGLRCYSPALDAGAFPAAPVATFWTSTPASGGGDGNGNSGSGSGSQSNRARVVELSDGAETRQDIETLQAVRLVRGTLRWLD